MKKTEKIEIRVSHGEKDVLTQLAQAEDRSVSEMLRDLARKYVLLNKGKSRPTFFTQKLLLALTLCFVIGGTAFTYVPRIMKPQTYILSGNLGGHIIASKITKFGHSEIKTSEHIVKILYSRRRNENPNMKIKIFQNPIANTEIVTHAEFRVNNEIPGIWNNEAALGETFYLLILSEDMERTEVNKALTTALGFEVDT